MIPIPPAFDTADDRCDRAIQPIAAWMIGFSIPSISVTRVFSAISLSRNAIRRSGSHERRLGASPFQTVSARSA
jgi:hypothetical protein